jgi:hypothetical protein
MCDERVDCCCEEPINSPEKMELGLYRELGSINDIQKCFRLMLSVIDDYKHYRKMGRPEEIYGCLERVESAIKELQSYKEVGCLEYVKYLAKKEMCKACGVSSCLGCNVSQ